MSLTMGSGPFGHRPAGRFNASFETPDPLVYAEPYGPRVRALLAGETVADSTATLLVHQSLRLPVFWFPRADVRDDVLARTARCEQLPGHGEVRRFDVRVGERVVPGAARVLERPAPGAPLPEGLTTLDWDAMDEWFVEDAQLFGHPHDPYSRIDVWKTTRHVVVRLEGHVLADSRRSQMLVETGLPPRFYLPAEDVRTDLLVPSPHRSRCAYKGSASYWHVRIGDRVEEDLVWSYADPDHDAEPVRDLLCFFNERVDLELDGEPVERPQTLWSPSNVRKMVRSG
jgi:uncharacterized protein (DUF427 family)